MEKVEILILGMGWAGSYIRNLCNDFGIAVAATTTSGRDGTLPFKFEGSNTPLEDFTRLPFANTIVITFPLSKVDGAQFLFLNLGGMKNYRPNILLFGSTSSWHGSSSSPWTSINGPLTPDARYNVEQSMLSWGACVLNLAGLYGGTRHPSSWLDRVAPTKDALQKKKSLHLIHGLDIARLVVQVNKNFTPGKRWIVTDMRIYDWYELAMSMGNDQHKSWVKELVVTEKIRSLPREHHLLERCIDSSNVWDHFGIMPEQSLYATNH